jgi:predicted RecA/RadA family phage recombinase
VSNNAQIINAGSIFVAEGATIDFVPEADVAAGTIVVVGKIVGIAKFGIRAGSRGSITVRGVFDVVKDPTTNIPAGSILYWSQISWHVVKTAYAHPVIGKAIESAPPGTLTVRLRLNQ